MDCVALLKEIKKPPPFGGGWGCKFLHFQIDIDVFYVIRHEIACDF